MVKGLLQIYLCTCRSTPKYFEHLPMSSANEPKKTIVVYRCLNLNNRLKEQNQGNKFNLRLHFVNTAV